MKKNLFRFGLTILFAGLLAACGGSDTNTLEGKKEKLAELKTQADEINAEIEKLKAEIEKEEPASEEVKITSVKAMPLATQNFEHFVEANGRLEAINNVLVSPQTGGAILSIPVREGSYVSQGQTVATLDNSILRNSISEVKLQLETAKTLFERQKALWDQNIGTEVQYIQAKAQVENLEKRISTMQSQAAQTVVKAPISGYVDEVRQKPGELASPGLGILRIVNSANLKIVARIPETYAGTIQNGDPAKVIFPDLQKEFSTQLNFVSQTIDNASRTFTAEAKLPSDKQLKPNLNATIMIRDQSKAGALVIPQNLIQRTEKGDIVYIAVAENGKQVARAKVVTSGLSFNGEVEITSGLSVGDIVITDGYQDLVDGQLVTY